MPAASAYRLTAGDERLAFDPDPARARSLLLAFVPPDDAQARERVRILAFLEEHPDALRRTCREGHLTASSLVLEAGDPGDERRGLLMLHAKLGRWLQLGGHCDGDGNLPGVALREALEESGIEGLAIDPRPVDLDVHPIPARGAEPEHLHLDVRFLCHAPAGAVPKANEEARELRWFAEDELAELGTDDSVRRLFRRAREARG